MAFETFADFMAMGKHGPYVWSAYGITLLVVVANILAPIIRRKGLVEEIKRKAKREQAES
ncbi:MAG: heme exporter protein CcmD [Pseudomonadales bacterium]|jgi:heme exporter protein D|uniref:heme exporter protein CcmD n=1 Tax=unclassified Ketobacter TaxID=2639109 RepID=UPI000C92EC44|nr:MULTISPECIES: heme exporter protein CcmD [unclassified Ketobacter]MAQ27627.1 heme exporter protein CcmD [Pseudomonadales bacterium]MEC8812989.1 heme exporter protein CcmD [Pseudomonadota bacterium]HAG92981.1 heme exporter protein CcmD [Gammaproteobacteria bacterium]MCK5792790.1 heme exporter protein CcmD [Ketobacter sp.]RLT89713.1 MAG: heme exporter protein CcmD [Ketobacter sp. GenoA1]|tara:strand:- start:21624 stop:21803 length:180 start_codon:yes stop_codon:yes gene_type:complete